MNLESTCSNDVWFWVEFESNLIGRDETAFQYDLAAQQKTNRLVGDQCGDRKKKTRRAKPRVDTIVANHQVVPSFRSQHPSLVNDPWV